MHIFISPDSRIPRLSFVVLLLALMLAAATFPARADIGPKPSMDFDFESESGASFRIVSGEQLECDAADCSDAQPLAEMGPQRFTCTETACSSLAYGYSEYHRLRISFADGSVLESNVFGKDYFDARYKVTIRANDLLVTELRGGARPIGLIEQMMVMIVYSLICLAALIFLVVLGAAAYFARQRAQPLPGKRQFLLAAWVLVVLGLLGGWVLTFVLPLTALIEGMIAWAYARLRKLPTLSLVTALTFANFLTLPALWYFVRLVGGDSYWLVLLIGEMFVWLVESVIMFVALRKSIRWWDAVLLSFIANAASFLVGLFLPM